MENRSVRTPSPITGNETGEAGDIQGWAHVNPDSLRFIEAISPRTGQPVLAFGAEVILKDGIRDVWLNSRSGWRRADGWLRKVFLARLDKEKESGKDMSIGLGDGPEGIGSI